LVLQQLLQQLRGRWVGMHMQGGVTPSGSVKLQERLQSRLQVRHHQIRCYSAQHHADTWLD